MKPRILISGGGRNYGKLYVYKEYEEAVNRIKDLVPDIAQKIINIVDSNYIYAEVKTAFLNDIATEIMSGADFSMCQNMDDIAEVKVNSMFKRMYG